MYPSVADKQLLSWEGGVLWLVKLRKGSYIVAKRINHARQIYVSLFLLACHCCCWGWGDSWEVRLHFQNTLQYCAGASALFVDTNTTVAVHYHLRCGDSTRAIRLCIQLKQILDGKVSWSAE